MNGSVRITVEPFVVTSTIVDGLVALMTGKSNKSFDGDVGTLERLWKNIKCR